MSIIIDYQALLIVSAPVVSDTAWGTNRASILLSQRPGGEWGAALCSRDS